MLAGAAPVEAPSGQVVRHRLNRGGDRELNRALHTIVMSRQRYHQPTKTYTTRRITQGKSQPRCRRCLKRTVARQLFRLLERKVGRLAAADSLPPPLDNNRSFAAGTGAASRD